MGNNLFEIMCDILDEKTSIEESAMRMYEEFYEKEAPIDTCNCGCDEAEIKVVKTSYGGFEVVIQCKNCGYCAGGYGHTEEKAKLRAKTIWNEWLKTKDFAVWKRGKNSYNK